MKQQIIQLLTQGELRPAIDELLKITQNTRPYNDVILLSARLNQLETEKRLGIVDAGAQQIQFNRLTQSVIATLDFIDWTQLDKQAVVPIINQPPTQGGVKIILFLGANPTNTTQLRLGQEVKEIDLELRLGSKRDSFDLEQQWAVTADTLRRALVRFTPNYIHFSGHGEMAGIVLEDNNGEAKLVPPDALADMISIFADNVECVILNACYSESQAKSIIQYVPYVIGMSAAVPDASAIKFAAGFYSGIAGGFDIEKSFKLGKASVAADGLEKDMILLLKKGSREFSIII
jgi:hypothetical protein